MFSDSDDGSFFEDSSENGSVSGESKPDYDGSNQNEEIGEEPVKPLLNKHLLQLKDRLGLDKFKDQLEAVQQKLISDRNSSDNKPKPVVVVYNDPRKRRKKPKLSADKSASSSGSAELPFQPEEFNLIQAKHDVKKFTIKSLKKTSKEQAQIALAVSLGAKPPKPQKTNYKVLKHTSKKEKTKLEKLKKTEHVFVNKTPLLKKDKKRKRDKNKVVNFDSKFGKYDPKLKKQLKKSSKK